jgi:hypothetical protein
MNHSEVTMNPLTIRMATPSDAAALTRLAVLDSAETPADPVLVAEVGGELWAAMSLDDHQLVGDPFRPTGEIQFLLVERARQLRSNRRHPGVLGRVFASVTGHGPRTAPRLVH